MKKQKKPQIIFPAILILVLVLVTGIFVGVKKNNDKSLPADPEFMMGERPSTITPSEEWLTFQTDAPFTFSYPNSWGIEAISGLTEKQGVHAVGSEGELFLYWGSGFGGACDENLMKPVKLKDETLTVCNEVIQGAEEWKLISKQLTPEVGFDARAYANPPADKNREMVLAILSTLSFKK